MGDFELVSFASGQAMAQGVADQWLGEVRARPNGENRRSYCVALSGGRIARTFFAAAAGSAKAQNIRLDSVDFFWADERCVPPSDPESNFAMAAELLFEPLDIPPDRIHRIRGEMDPQAAATGAQAELCRHAHVNEAGQPALDLIFLGMGEDGHVASLFPGESQEAMLDSAAYRPVIAVKPPPRRITLGYQAIAAAGQVWVLVSGGGKENALAESLRSDGQTSLARVLRLRSHTRIFSDISPRTT